MSDLQNFVSFLIISSGIKIENLLCAPNHSETALDIKYPFGCPGLKNIYFFHENNRKMKFFGHVIKVHILC